VYVPRVTAEAKEGGEQLVDAFRAAWADGAMDREERAAFEARLLDHAGVLRFADACDALGRGIGRARSARHLGDLFGAVMAAQAELPDREAA
jgi:hypothetical protein